MKLTPQQQKFKVLVSEWQMLAHGSCNSVLFITISLIWGHWRQSYPRFGGKTRKRGTDLSPFIPIFSLFTFLFFRSTMMFSSLTCRDISSPHTRLSWWSGELETSDYQNGGQCAFLSLALPLPHTHTHRPRSHQDTEAKSSSITTHRSTGYLVYCCAGWLLGIY